MVAAVGHWMMLLARMLLVLLARMLLEARLLTGRVLGRLLLVTWLLHRRWLLLQLLQSLVHLNSGVVLAM
jgi:hypothetical protein